jgi:uncharacterized protein
MARPPERYRGYNRYLLDKYGEKAYRVALDAGFSCPNRGDDRSKAGCSYCDEYGSRAPYQPQTGPAVSDKSSLKRQVERGIGFIQGRYGARILLLYFQAFSGTWAPPEVLRECYDYCLSLYPFSELIVSTRPDCIDEQKAELLASYISAERDVWVELGLQSAHDRTLKRINRGHTAADFFDAYRLLDEKGIKKSVHLIFGLPGEEWKEMEETVRIAASLEPEGIKIHNLHVPRGAPLLQEYLLGTLAVPCDRRHLEYVIRALELLPPKTVIQRMTCDTPEERLAAPRRFMAKGEFYQKVRAELEERATRQGRLYNRSLQ